ncbi:coiled-coil domain-containing protein [Cloacibacterium sp. TD35]|uniref:coiled-coil domain-containing protein n=1 Tax=Cloacibacterium sp. TD35 TaxID=2976818 RepID=UPI00237D4718|nr:hypothetical protein [Cloacibacterium sp. TD35]WDT67458.1 hypothetical protein N7277_08965 [Cloacibacterium sp. TD35]
MKLRDIKTENSTMLDKMADSVISWIGSTASLVFHTILFIVSFLLPLFKVVEFEEMLLVLTTIVSLEAIYLSIFIQMSVNKSNKHIEVIKEDVNEIQEDIDEIQEDIDEIQEDIDEIQEDIDEIADDEDEDEHKEKAQKVILKSNVSNNKQEIKELKAKIHDLQAKLEDLIQKDFN